ncbi:MAG: hypothetical protein RIQ89_372 [Bacteroidota bacterium]
MLRKVLISFILLLLLIIGGVYGYLKYQSPNYDGTVTCNYLKQTVDVYFDEQGVPHIYAETEHDLYFALGYVHAQDRLFQMEMMRRVSAGRLSEILGSSLLEVDKFFRTLGVYKHAAQSAKTFFNDSTQPYQKAANAYLEGLNHFIATGPAPLEFSLIGIPKEQYTINDLYLIVDFMSFNFQMAFRTDPLMTWIDRTLGKHYFESLKSTEVASGNSYNPLADTIKNSDYLSFRELENLIPVPLMVGSNAWAVSPKRSVSKSAYFANDTHIGYAQPSVWYEAHLQSSSFNFYGNHLAGFPFAPIGHTPDLAWGLTIFENDDLDFFENTTTVLTTKELIKVKDSSSVEIVVRNSEMGPIVSDVMKIFGEAGAKDVSICWSLLQQPNNLFEITYNLTHSKKITDIANEVQKIKAPGLNFVYADRWGNIAHWGAASLVKRAHGANGHLIQDGADENKRWQGFYDFSYNPQSVNPANGFVLSANQAPDTIKGVYHQGYYVPANRANRIYQVLDDSKQIDFDKHCQLQYDVMDGNAVSILKLIFAQLSKDQMKSNMATELLQWDGQFKGASAAPVYYTKLLYNVLQGAMADELGNKKFDEFLTTHVSRITPKYLLANALAPWWDNVLTTSGKETLAQIVSKAFEKTELEIKDQFKNNATDLRWDKVHFLMHPHPVGSKKPLDKIFNVGPFAVEGGNETINQTGFDMNEKGIYPAKFGPALRRVIDFGNAGTRFSILPTGQSGNLMSEYYDDQAKRYADTLRREELMDKSKIIAVSKNHLVLKPGH